MGQDTIGFYAGSKAEPLKFKYLFESSKAYAFKESRPHVDFRWTNEENERKARMSWAKNEPAGYLSNVLKTNDSNTKLTYFKDPSAKSLFKAGQKIQASVIVGLLGRLGAIVTAFEAPITSAYISLATGIEVPLIQLSAGSSIICSARQLEIKQRKLEKKKEIDEKIPKFLRKSFYEFAGLEGTELFQHIESGTSEYKRFICTKR